jgi:hypothetical protein
MAEEDKSPFILRHKNARSFAIDGTITNKGSLYSFEQKLKKLKTYVVQHVHDCMGELSMITNRQQSLFASDHANSGAVSQDALLREERQLHTLVNDILAKNLLVPGPKEDEAIINIILKENN